jgi:hypothetical protein
MRPKTPVNLLVVHLYSKGVIIMKKIKWKSSIVKLRSKLLNIKLPRKHRVFWLVGYWTAIHWALIILRFLNIIPDIKIDSALPFGNVFLLLLYVVTRQLKAMTKAAVRKTPGEIFFVGWWLLLGTVLLISALPNDYHFKTVSKELWLNIFFVTPIYIGSRWPKLTRCLKRLLDQKPKPRGVIKKGDAGHAHHSP